MCVLQCPECWAENNLDEGQEVGEIMSCHDCGVELEIRGDPLRLELAPMEQDDWGE